MALHDYPKLHAAFKELENEKELLLSGVAALREEYEELRMQMAPMESRVRELTKLLKASQSSRLTEVCNEMARIAMATGGRALSDTAE